MVPASRSIAEIQDALVKHSATGVLYKYEQGTGRIEALQFVLRIKHKDVAFSLPVPDIPLRSRLGPVRRSCTRTLRVIPPPPKLGTMPYGQKIGTCQFIEDYMPATIPPAACLVLLAITLPSNAATK